MLKHVVLWKMAADSEEELAPFLAELSAMANRIPDISALSCGPLLDRSDFDAGLCVDLPDRAALDRYRDHAEHLPVVERLRAITTQILAADYEY